MKGPVVVDTSVAFKWLLSVGENAVDEAVTLLRDHLSGEIVLVAPTTLPVELANGLRYSALGEDEVLELLEAFGYLHLELLDTDAGRLRSATSLAYAHGITVYDALFLTIAQELKCPLVTADRRAFEGIDTPVEVRLL